MKLIIGPIAFAVFFWLGCIRKIEPFFSYFYLFAWGSYLWIVNRLLAPFPSPAGRRERAEGEGTGLGPHLNLLPPSVGEGVFAMFWLFCFSTSLWCFFELLNFRLKNWSYIGVPRELWLRWPGYALSFATVAPGILWTASLFENRHSPRPLAGNPSRPLTTMMDPGLRHAGMTVVGLIMTLLPLLFPRWFFPLVWGGIFFLAEPYVQKWGGHSLIADWRAGCWQTTRALLLSGLICGIFWEFCNFWAGSKWVYHLPYWNFGKVFEMPILGFIGFPAFALEVHVLHEAARLFWQKRSSLGRQGLITGMLAFWIAVFYGIDRWTVLNWR